MPMGILQQARPAVVICTRDRPRATAFYGEVLGLTLAKEDSLASVFDCGGVTLRVSHVPDFVPHEHTILGFTVPDVAATVPALSDNGVVFVRHEGFAQDALGVLTLPGGTIHVAWFKDPDGNLLSVTDA
jgi:catechol 2,3-dioxygenase-like lactoylglutathione lyase family enzyme